MPAWTELGHGDHSNILSGMCQDMRQRFCYRSMSSSYEIEYVKAPSPHRRCVALPQEEAITSRSKRIGRRRYPELDRCTILAIHDS